ncbi:cysteine-rich CWC family protein [Marinobacter mobilis]|uniref:cysteine-rich CWC family protein n=1 Tax=Marinobacter mobilis TaxID=488533 RepID=UPI000A94B049|nr:cysteine-rich CWC family protein [Marinobacter mobilis]
MTTPTNSQPNTPQANLCPLCGEENRCAITAGDDPASCWCQAPEIEFTEAMKAAVPSHLRLSACLCPACISALASRTE